MTNKEWALKMIPVLVHWAQYSWEAPHYYSDLSNAVGHKTSQIGGILGWIHDIITNLANNHGVTIPTLNALVISKSSQKPSDGLSYVNESYKDISEEDAAKLRSNAHQYDWSWVLNELNLAPYNPPITYWILPSNSQKYRIHEYLKKRDVVDWSQDNNFTEGDIIFLYSTTPENMVRYIFRVERTNISKADYIEDSEYWINGEDYQAAKKHNRYVRLRLKAQLKENDQRLSLKKLRELGVKTFQGASQLKDQKSIDYILGVFKVANDFDSDLLDTIEESFYEGAKRQVTVNSYERDSKARKRCIEKYGAVCSICGFDFEKIYGELGKGFIHVHHIVPIHTIGKGYEVNPEKDLIPVCPNCHAMLHRGKNANARTIEDLKSLLKK